MCFFVNIIAEQTPAVFQQTIASGGTPYNGLYGEALPERGTFFRLQVHERVGILLAYVYDRVGKAIISALKGVLYVSGRYTN